ncbi:MAG: hypothetical protein ACM3S1_13805 [Hyphomicrobiales bacterium]
MNGRSREEQNRLLLERIELAKQWDDDDIRRWRNATDEERARAIEGLAELADEQRRAHGEPFRAGPLDFPPLRRS